MSVPSSYTLVFDEQRIRRAVSDLAASISPWAASVKQSTGQELLAVCVLRGGAHFFSDLVRELSCSIEPAYCLSSAYSVETNSLSERGISVLVDHITAKGRTVLMVDDICETGTTLLALSETFRKQGAADVRSAVIIRRQGVKAVFTPTWSGFEYPGNDWFVGYGMDDRNSFSNLKEIFIVPAQR